MSGQVRFRCDRLEVLCDNGVIGVLVEGIGEWLTQADTEALYRALGQHLGAEPLPGWRATRLERDGFAVEQESTLSCGWWAFRVERDADDGFPRDRWIDELNQHDGFSTAPDAMRAVEALAGKEKPE
jgi:hypothetical protein